MLNTTENRVDSVIVPRLNTEMIFSVPQKKRLEFSMGNPNGISEVLEVESPLSTERIDSPSRTAALISVPAITKMVSVDPGVHANVITIWEGEVTAIEGELMIVKLRDRQGFLPEHTAEVDLEWVAAQDRELVKPGAVFYWTLYREIKRGAISGSQEIRFRRLPNWTKSQISEIYRDAEELMGKFTTKNKYAD